MICVINNDVSKEIEALKAREKELLHEKERYDVEISEDEDRLYRKVRARKRVYVELCEVRQRLLENEA